MKNLSLKQNERKVWLENDSKYLKIATNTGSWYEHPLFSSRIVRMVYRTVSRYTLSTRALCHLTKVTFIEVKQGKLLFQTRYSSYLLEPSYVLRTFFFFACLFTWLTLFLGRGGPFWTMDLLSFIKPLEAILSKSFVLIKKNRNFKRKYDDKQFKYKIISSFGC